MNKGTLRGFADNLGATLLKQGELGDPLNMYGEQHLAAGEETFERRWAVQNSNHTLPNQTMRLVYFTARKTEIITQARVISGNTAAGATPSLVRWGVYVIGVNGEATLLAAIASDTSLFAAASTLYTRTFQSPWTKVKGQRYAFALLCVTGAAAPTIMSNSPFNPGSAAATAEGSTTPILFTAVNSQADLPASLTPAQLAAGSSAGGAYAVLLP